MWCQMKLIWNCGYKIILLFSIASQFSIESNFIWNWTKSRCVRLLISNSCIYKMKLNNKCILLKLDALNMSRYQKKKNFFCSVYDSMIAFSMYSSHVLSIKFFFFILVIFISFFFSLLPRQFITFMRCWICTVWRIYLYVHIAFYFFHFFSFSIYTYLFNMHDLHIIYHSSSVFDLKCRGLSITMIELKNIL